MSFASEEYHNKQVKRLLIQPKQLILDRNGDHELSDIVASGTMNFFDEGRLIAQPDGVLFGKWGDIYVFEYKSQGHRGRAIKQLEIARSHIKKCTGENARCFYIKGDLGNYNIEEVHL